MGNRLLTLLVASLAGACSFQSRLNPETVVLCAASAECPPGLQCAAGVCVSTARPLLSEPVITPQLARRGTTVTIELEARVEEGPDVRLLTETSLRRDVTLSGVDGSRFRFQWTVPPDASAGRYDVLASWRAPGGEPVGPVLLGAVAVDTEAPRVVEAQLVALSPPPGLPEAVRPLVTQVTRGSVLQVRVEFDEPVASARLLAPPLRFQATDIAERRLVFEGRLDDLANPTEGPARAQLEAADPAGNQTVVDVSLGLVVDITPPPDLPVEQPRAIEYLRAPDGLPLSRPGLTRLAEVSFAEGVLGPSDLGVVWLDRFVAGVARGSTDGGTTLQLALRDDWPLLDVQRFDLAGNASVRSRVRDVVAVSLATRTARACASPTVEDGLLPPERRDGFTPGAAGVAFPRVQCPPFDGGLESDSEWRIAPRGTTETTLAVHQTISRFGSGLSTTGCLPLEPGDCVVFTGLTTPFELGGHLMQVNAAGLLSREYQPGDGGAGFGFINRRVDGGVLRRVEGTAAPVPGGGALLLGGRLLVDGGLHADSWWLEGDVQRGLTSKEVPGLPPRAYPVAALDPRLGQVVVFGGLGPTGELLGDTWLWSPDGGFRVLAGVGPSPRVGAVFGWHPVEERLFLYGGTTSSGRSGELWEFVDAGWALLGQGPPRAFSSFRYSTVHGTLILERGVGDGGTVPLLALTSRGVERLRPYELRPTPVCDPGFPTASFASRFGNDLATVCEQNDQLWLRTAQADGGERDGARVPRPDGGRSSMLGPFPLEGGLLLTGGFDTTGAVGSVRSWYVTEQGLRELPGGAPGNLGPCSASTDQTRVACVGTVAASFSAANASALSGPNPAAGAITWVPGLDSFVAIESGQVWRLPSSAAQWQRLPSPPVSPSLVTLPGAVVVNAGPPETRRLWSYTDDAGWTLRGRSSVTTMTQGLFGERGWVFTDERGLQAAWGEALQTARPMVQLEFDALALVSPDGQLQEGRVVVQGRTRSATDAGLALHWWNGVDWTGLARMPSTRVGLDQVELSVPRHRLPGTRAWSLGVVGSPATPDTTSTVRVEEAELWIRYRLP